MNDQIKMHDLTTKLVPVGEIKPYAQNPRKNAKGVEAVKKSIKEFGVLAPILLDKDGFIVYGHTRWQAAVELGLESYPCIVATDLDPEKARAYRIADNAVADFSDWDPVKLMAELDAIKGLQFDSLPLLDLGLDKFLPVDMRPTKEVNFTATETVPQSEPDTFQHSCPRCGYQWNQS